MIEGAAKAPPAPPRRPPDGFQTAAAIVAGLTPVVLLLIVLITLQQAWPAITHYGWGFLLGVHWNPVKLDFGAWPFIWGTLVTSFVALAIALPVGVGVAVFLAEPGQVGLRGAIGIGVELLAAIPSVVYGLWALYVLGPWLNAHAQIPVSSHLGSIAILSPPARQTSVFIASVVVAVMILPTLAAVSRDVIKAVPNAMREATYALGATWWEVTWRVILPAARGGIFGATVLALGRALGETIAVTLVIGNRPEVPKSIFYPGYTLASVIANEFTEATGQLYPAALIELGLVLVMVTVAVNVGAQLLVHLATSRAR